MISNWILIFTGSLWSSVAPMHLGSFTTEEACSKARQQVISGGGYNPQGSRHGAVICVHNGGKE